MGENVEVDNFSMSDYLATSPNITPSWTSAYSLHTDM